MSSDIIAHFTQTLGQISNSRFDHQGIVSIVGGPYSRGWVIKSFRGHRGPCNPYKTCNCNLYIFRRNRKHSVNNNNNYIFLSWMLSVQMEDRSDDDHRNFSSVTMITRWRRAKRVGKCSLVLWQFVSVYGIINLVGIFARPKGTFNSRLRNIWALLGSDNRTNWNHEVSRDCPAPRCLSIVTSSAVHHNW